MRSMWPLRRRCARLRARIAQAAREETGYKTGYQPGGDPGDRRVGVVWHTQGSGKSLTMAFYAGRIILHPAMENPTIVVLTDRNDLDDQLFGTFARCQDCCASRPSRPRAGPTCARSSRWLRRRGVFTTIQKFFPEEKGDRHPVSRTGGTSSSLPTRPTAASTISSTASPGTCGMLCPTPPSSASPARPSRMTDANTRAVFGDYISVYDIQRAVEDGATVPIYYESRLAKLELKESERPKIDPEFEEVDRRRGSRTQGEAQDQMGPARSRGRIREAAQARCPRPR